MAPEVGFEPTTNRLTADRSTTELLRITGGRTTYIASTPIQAKNVLNRRIADGRKPAAPILPPFQGGWRFHQYLGLKPQA